MISTRVGLQAALNGDRTKTEHSAIPISVEELARDARRGGRRRSGHEGPRGLRRACRRDI
jgi:hypothetical protein